jgi:RND family efflux transporter MFP subunit
VSGRIISVSPDWDDGGTFREGDELLRIDDADYRAALANAESAVAEAALALRTEDARAEQAMREWKKLETGAPANDLVTRAPHIKSVKARQAAAQAAVEHAQRDVERCRIRAPYDGRIRRTLTDLGSWVAPGTTVGEFFRTTAWQVRLPLALDDYGIIDLAKPLPVTLTATAGGRTLTIEATATATAGEIDRATRSMPLIATITASPDPLLAPGLFVKASLSGRTLSKVVRLPRRCLLPGNRVAIVMSGDQLHIQPVTISRSAVDEVYVSDGIKPGERVLATTLAILTESMKVKPLPQTLPAK